MKRFGLYACNTFFALALFAIVMSPFWFERLSTDRQTKQTEFVESKAIQAPSIDPKLEIGRLVEKDPARRYRCADEALADLLHDPSASAPHPSAEEEAAAEECHMIQAICLSLPNALRPGNISSKREPHINS